MIQVKWLYLFHYRTHFCTRHTLMYFYIMLYVAQCIHWTAKFIFRCIVWYDSDQLQYCNALCRGFFFLFRNAIHETLKPFYKSQVVSGYAFICLVNHLISKMFFAFSVHEVILCIRETCSRAKWKLKFSSVRKSSVNKRALCRNGCSFAMIWRSQFELVKGWFWRNGVEFSIHVQCEEFS